MRKERKKREFKLGDTVSSPRKPGPVDGAKWVRGKNGRVIYWTLVEDLNQIPGAGLWEQPSLIGKQAEAYDRKDDL